MKKTHCPVCRRVSTPCTKNKKYTICSTCGSWSVVRPPSIKKIVEGLDIWAKKIIKDSQNISLPTRTIYQRVNTLIHMNSRGKKLLDVGCGSGSFLFAARGLGFSVSGMDISHQVCRFLRNNKILSYTSLSTLHSNTFDIVTAFDVIEHTTNPKYFLREIKRVTKNNGILFLSTPNAGSVSARILGESWWVFGPKGHYVLFTPRSLEMLVKQCGFSIIEIKTNTLTQWVQTKSDIVNKIGNKIVYCLFFPLLPFLFRFGLGDNIEILAKKIN